MIALGQITSQIQQIPPLPDVVFKVLELSDDPECSVKDLVKVMRLDQGITFRVLRLCNSAHFGLPRKIMFALCHGRFTFFLDFWDCEKC